MPAELPPLQPGERRCNMVGTISAGGLNYRFIAEGTDLNMLAGMLRGFPGRVAQGP